MNKNTYEKLSNKQSSNSISFESLDFLKFTIANLSFSKIGTGPNEVMESKEQKYILLRRMDI